MRIVLSRKGFDSGYGGYPSPILPDGTMVSLPIPNSSDSARYSDLKLSNGISYFDLMRSINPRLKINGEWKGLTETTRCHLDPDLNEEITMRNHVWKAALGQIGAAQGHLAKQKVTTGDIFLFFGWFRKYKDLKSLTYEENMKNVQAIFGYLQVGEIFNVGVNTEVPEYIKAHPHVVSSERRKVKTNSVYVAKDRLTWDKKISGAGHLRFDQSLVLTKTGYTRSKWNLPDFFKDVNMTYHSERSWKKDYFQSAAKGQEFVVKDSLEAINWAKSLISKNAGQSVL